VFADTDVEVEDTPILSYNEVLSPDYINEFDKSFNTEYDTDVAFDESFNTEYDTDLDLEDSLNTDNSIDTELKDSLNTDNSVNTDLDFDVEIEDSFNTTSIDNSGNSGIMVQDSDDAFVLGIADLDVTVDSVIAYSNNEDSWQYDYKDVGNTTVIGSFNVDNSATYNADQFMSGNIINVALDNVGNDYSVNTEYDTDVDIEDSFNPEDSFNEFDTDVELKDSLNTDNSINTEYDTDVEIKDSFNPADIDTSFDTDVTEYEFDDSFNGNDLVNQAAGEDAVWVDANLDLDFDSPIIPLIN
jgi:hypothetical protein